MEIMRNDLEITLTDDELEEAYQERLLAINRQKAREHLIDLFDDTRDEFEQSYSISLDEFMADNKYIDVIIDHFNECENLNASENVMSLANAKSNPFASKGNTLGVLAS